MTSRFDNQQLIEADRKLIAYINKYARHAEIVWKENTFGFLVMGVLMFLWDLKFALVLVPVMAGVLILRDRVIAAHLRRISDRKLTAKVVNKLLLGPVELENIYSYTPVPWRWIFLEGRPQKFEDWLLLVAKNLSWYQHEPKLNISAWWLIQTLLVVVTVAGISLTFVPNGASSNYLWFVFGLGAAFINHLLITAAGNKMKLNGARALWAELQTFLPENPVSEDFSPRT